MKSVLFFLLLSLSLSSLASSLHYSSFDLTPSPLDLSKNIDHQFLEQGFYSLINAKEGVASLGINQIFFKSENQFVLVKYGIKGSYPLDEIIKTPSGFLVHRSIKNQVLLLYFRGFNREFVKLTLSRLDQKVSGANFFKDFLLSSAHASDCAAPVGENILNQSQELSSISAAAAWEHLKGCLTNIGSGFGNSAKGVVPGAVALAKGVWSAVTHPIEFIEETADSVELFLTKTSSFVQGLIADPNETLRQVGSKLGKDWEKISQTIATTSPEMKINFVCSLLGSLGFEASLALLTGGAATGKLLWALQSLGRKFSMLGKIMSLLAQFRTSTLSMLNLQGAKLEKFMKGIFDDSIPEGDLRQLDELANVSDELSLRTLSCYME